MKLSRIGNASNAHQGDYKKVLCVCSGGLLRSPTAALVLAQEPYGYNTRSCGTCADYALNMIEDVLIHWADEIVVMEEVHAGTVREMMSDFDQKPIVCLDITDSYSYRDATLIELIKEKYEMLRTWKD